MSVGTFCRPARSFPSARSTAGGTKTPACGGLPSAFSNGNNAGGSLALDGAGGIRCYCIAQNFADVQSNFANKFGYPLFMVDGFSNHTGFLQTQDYIFDYSLATLNERNMISNYLNSGIYIE